MISAISEWSALDSDSSPTSSKPLARTARVDHLADALQRPLPDRAGDHPGLAEPAAAGAAAEDLDARPLVHGLGQRHERLLRVRPCVQVGGGALGDGAGHPRVDRGDGGDRAVGAVGHVVERRHVAAVDRGQPQQQLPPPARAAVGLPGLDDVGDLADHLLAVADRRDVDEVGDRLRVERRVAARDDDRVVGPSVDGVQRDAREVERREQVGVAELGGEADPEQVERAERPVRVDGERGDAVLAHQRLEVRPDRVAALGERVGAAR